MLRWAGCIIQEFDKDSRWKMNTWKNEKRDGSINLDIIIIYYHYCSTVLCCAFAAISVSMRCELLK